MRSLTPAGAAALASPQVGLVMFLHIASAPEIRLNSTPAPILYDGYSWQGGATLGTIDAVSDEVGATKSLRLSMSGVPTDVLSLAQQDQIRGVACRLTVGVMDMGTRAFVDRPAVFTGFVDTTPITLDLNTVSVSAIVNHRGETFNRAKPFRNTDADQQRVAPGDTSRRFVVAQSQVQDVWPERSFFKR